MPRRERKPPRQGPTFTRVHFTKGDLQNALIADAEARGGPLPAGIKRVSNISQKGNEVVTLEVRETP